MKEMVLKIPRLDDKVIAQYTSKVNTPKSSGKARGRPRKNVNKQLPVVNIEKPNASCANSSLKDFSSNVNDLLQIEEIELSPGPKKAGNSKTRTGTKKSSEFLQQKNVNKQLQDEDFSPMGKTRSAKKKSTPAKSHSKIVVNKQNPFVDLGQRIENVNKQKNIDLDFTKKLKVEKKPSKILHDATSQNIFLQCRFCDEFYEKESNLKNHVLNHFKEKLLPFIPMAKPFHCPDCNQVSRDRTSLLRHYAFTHKAFLKIATEDDFKARTPNSKAKAVLPLTTDVLEPVVQID